jgi:plasmid segregation protein ParM
MANMVSVVRSIDVGYGMTKYVTHSESSGRSFSCSSFPSIVALGKGRQLGAGYFDVRDTVVVKWHGQSYEVGPDVALAFRGHNTRVLDANYIRSDDYQILVRGALRNIGLPRLDLLVLGAPLLNFESIAPVLERSFTGALKISESEGVEVQKVAVLPQPVGGLAWCGNLPESSSRDPSDRSLLIDIGYFTVDWLVAEGTRALPERSGSYPGGVSSLIRELASEISRTTGEDITTMAMWEKIDRCLYAGQKLRIYGKEYDLGQHAQTVKSMVSQTVAAIAQRIGDAKDLSQMLLVGGGAPRFADALRALYPNMVVNTVPDAPFANVKGFQLIGEAMANATASA